MSDHGSGAAASFGGPGGDPAGPGLPVLALRATRPLYLPTSVIPGLAGLAAAIGVDGARWWAAPVAILALLCAHAAANVINDVEDFARGVDDVDKMDNSRVFTTQLMTVRGGRRLARGLLATSFALGVGLAAAQGPALLVIGIVGLAAAYGYSAGPMPLKYQGLGDVTILPVMGPLITQGAYTAITGDGFAASAFWIGFAPGLLITAVLAGNNLSDISGDRAAGVRTLAVRVGFARARALYLTALTLAYVTPLTVWCVGLFAWPVLLPLLTAPLALRCVRSARAPGASGASGADTLKMLAPETAQLHLVFCTLLVIGIVLTHA